jgi:hypothetical protein
MALAGVVALLLLDECAAGAAGPAGFHRPALDAADNECGHTGARALTAVAR